MLLSLIAISLLRRLNWLPCQPKPKRRLVIGGHFFRGTVDGRFVDEILNTKQMNNFLKRILGLLSLLISISVVAQNSVLVDTRIDNLRSITRVSLVGYEFNIASGDSQTYALDSGMQGGYENIIVIYGNLYYSSNSVSTKVNFYKGKVRTITLEGCTDYEGYDVRYLQ